MKIKQFTLCTFVALAFLVSVAQQFASASASASPPVVPGDIRIDGVEAENYWLLSEGRYVRAKMPMQLVHPRPDIETNGWARHRKAYPGLEYRIPISVQGGAYPFYFDIIEAPDGMSIGQTVWDSDYGVLSWTPNVSHNGEVFPVTIRVYGQEYERETVDTVGPTSIDVSFVIRVTDSTEDFIFVDSSVSESGDGSIGSPIRTLIEVFGDGNDLVTYPGRAVYLREGAYDTLTNNWHANKGYAHADNARKPVVFLGYPGEDATIVFTNGKIFAGVGGSDLYLGGLTLRDSPMRPRGFHGVSEVTPVGSRMVTFGGHRTTAFENHWINTRPQYLDYSQIYSFERLSDTVFKVLDVDATDAFRRNVAGTNAIFDGLNRNNNIRVFSDEQSFIEFRVYDASYDGQDTHVQIYSYTAAPPVLPQTVFNVTRMYKGGNEGFIGSSRANSHRPYFTFVGNRVDDWNTPGNVSTQAGGIGSFYANKYMVFENNSFGFGLGWEAINLKQGTEWVSIRRNDLLEGRPVYALISVYVGSASPEELDYRARTEVCYNRVRHENPGSSLDLVRSNQPRVSGPHLIWVYRNTLIGRASTYNYNVAEIVFENNIMFTDHASPHGVNSRVEISGDIVFPTAQIGDVIDSSLNLVGDYRNLYHGLFGHEVSR